MKWPWVEVIIESAVNWQQAYTKKAMWYDRLLHRNRILVSEIQKLNKAIINRNARIKRLKEALKRNEYNHSS